MGRLLPEGVGDGTSGLNISGVVVGRLGLIDVAVGAGWVLGCVGLAEIFALQAGSRMMSMVIVSRDFLFFMAVRPDLSMSFH
jgi:hypothetical protein